MPDQYNGSSMIHQNLRQLEYLPQKQNSFEMNMYPGQLVHKMIPHMFSDSMKEFTNFEKAINCITEPEMNVNTDNSMVINEISIIDNQHDNSAN